MLHPRTLTTRQRARSILRNAELTGPPGPSEAFLRERYLYQLFLFLEMSHGHNSRD